MKKIYLFLIILVFTLAACSDNSTGDGGGGGETTSTVVGYATFLSYTGSGLGELVLTKETTAIKSISANDAIIVLGGKIKDNNVVLVLKGYVDLENKIWTASAASGDLVFQLQGKLDGDNYFTDSVVDIKVRSLSNAWHNTHRTLTTSATIIIEDVASSTQVDGIYEKWQGRWTSLIGGGYSKNYILVTPYFIVDCSRSDLSSAWVCVNEELISFTPINDNEADIIIFAPENVRYGIPYGKFKLKSVAGGLTFTNYGNPPYHYSSIDAIDNNLSTMVYPLVR